MDFGQDEGDEWRRDHSSHGCSGVDDAHSGRAPLDGEPFGDGSRGSWKSAAFAGAQEQPARGKHDDAAGEAVAGAGQGPKDHDDEKTAPCAEFIEEPAATEIHQAISDEEGGIQSGLDLIADRDVGLNSLDGPWERLAI